MKRLMLLAVLLAAVACSHSGAPLVGISCSRYSDNTYLPDTYPTAITAAGGAAVILPTVGTEAAAAALMARLDGLLLSGGDDVDPSWYGEEPVNGTVRTDPVRDRSDSLLLAAALAAGKPVLAICRGSQLANVFLGGSLYQDIPTQLPENIGHRDVAHNISCEPGSLLARIYGRDSVMVNSFHHQCVKQTGKGVTVTARSADGIVEAWEAPGIIAVQFHPERMITAGEGIGLPLFKAYVDLLR